MERIQIDGKGYVPARALVGWMCRVAFFTALGFGMGAVAIIPWLAKTSIWQSARAEKMAESMLDQAARCEGRLMVIEKACPMQVRAAMKARNVGGE
jgi:hypothetical protein